MSKKTSGQAPFVFSHCGNLHTLPEKAQSCEVKLHGGFAVDKQGDGHIYYGMPGCGLMRIHPDLNTQEIIDLPAELTPINFHSAKISEFDGKRRLILPANNDEKVAIVGLDGNVDFILDRPEFEEYQDKAKPFKPTDSTPVGNTLYVADGYGSNYISTADLSTQQWTGLFGGKTDDPQASGLFGTAHGMNRAPDGKHLSIADRPHARFELFTYDGRFHAARSIPAGSKPCGIDFLQRHGRWYALVGSLDDPQEGRAAPIYILDGETYEILSTIRPKEELGVELADHIHNTVWYEYDGRLYLICQAWNPGYYFVLELVE